jgi:hypothetical protein
MLCLCVCDTLQQGKEIERPKDNANGISTQLPQVFDRAVGPMSERAGQFDVEKDSVTKAQELEEQIKDSHRYMREVQPLELVHHG